jgi:putative sterol carrier protein
MKPIAVNHGRINERFYHYVQANAVKLAHLAYGELGPVAAMAIGDWYFDKKNMIRPFPTTAVSLKTTP